ncbi:MAG: hypothetical protein LBI53_00295 [Candidatus Peribacteria bacterium]|nr:hypothetical protein [Candidatus Peribacteria bacterium]
MTRLQRTRHPPSEGGQRRRSGGFGQQDHKISLPLTKSPFAVPPHQAAESLFLFSEGR